jgi:threonine/homoserine/homoserine lactone efflux protein
MSIHGFTLFCLVYLLATATPGPGIGAIVARVIARNTPGIGFFIAGFVVGDLVWFAFAATGMAVLAQTAHVLFTVIKYAGALYLLFLALRLWRAPAGSVPEGAVAPQQNGWRLWLAGLSLTLGNPKVMVFFLALLPTVIDLTSLSVASFLEIAAAMCVILTGVLSSYAAAARRARKLFRSQSALRWLNRGTGTVVAGAAIAVATR